jgi:hypothetical protein
MQIISPIKLNRKYITRVPKFKLLSLNHYVATPIYIYMQSKCPKERKEREAAVKENKFRHTARRTVIKIPSLRDI